jgi:hypothetical protein
MRLLLYYTNITFFCNYSIINAEKCNYILIKNSHFIILHLCFKTYAHIFETENTIFLTNKIRNRLRY